jgi:hypothetical protein
MATWLDSGVDGEVCYIDSRLGGYASPDAHYVVVTEVLFADPNLNSLQHCQGIFISRSELKLITQK